MRSLEIAVGTIRFSVTLQCKLHRVNYKVAVSSNKEEARHREARKRKSIEDVARNILHSGLCNFLNVQLKRLNTTKTDGVDIQ